eukprot:757337-Hanusia_phi.AAC.1
MGVFAASSAQCFACLEMSLSRSSSACGRRSAWISIPVDPLEAAAEVQPASEERADTSTSPQSADKPQRPV